MRVIPVLDLKGGAVVRAEGGRRDGYRPIVTPLAGSSDPVAVVEGLRTLHPFRSFYVADLDAIEGRRPNHEALGRLAAMPTPPDLWLDAGFATAEPLEAMLSRPGIRPVLGSESQADESLLRRFRDRVILSLDFFADGFRGPPRLLAETDLWPDTVIVMTLAKVGSGAGPDIGRLADVKARADGRAVVAAGGVRNAADLETLARLGIAAALVATSLHDGTLGPRDLVAFDQPPAA